MRVMLVQPPQGARFGFTRVLLIEPLGLEMVGASLQSVGHDLRLVDLRLDKISQFGKELDGFSPAAVGISCGFTTDVYTTLSTARRIKDRSPATFVFAGGHQASLIPGDLLFPGSPVDAVVIGEGEDSTVALIGAVEHGDDPGGLAGVMTLDNRYGGFTIRPPIENLDDLPLPARQLTKRYRRRYHHGFSVWSAAVETSRGCPFDCNFCSVWRFYQRKTRQRSPERIVEDLEQARTFGARNIFLTDDIAFLQHDAYEELGRHIEKANLNLSYAAETRADLVVRYSDLFELWQKIGTDTVFLGVERFDDRGLDSLRKRTRGGSDTNLEAIEIIRGAGITPMTSLIADPDWDDEQFDSLENSLRELSLPNPAFTILTPLPGTELWDTRKEQIITDDYNFYDVLHLTVEARLGPERFYERIARLYNRTDIRTQLSGTALFNLLGMAVQGHAGVVARILGAVTRMRDAKAYLDYPGLERRPSFVPEDFGTIPWIEEGRSYLARAESPPLRRAASQD